MFHRMLIAIGDRRLILSPTLNRTNLLVGEGKAARIWLTTMGATGEEEGKRNVGAEEEAGMIPRKNPISRESALQKLKIS